MADELEDKYSRFKRNTNIDLLAEIAAGGATGGLEDYYNKTEIDSALAEKADSAELSDLPTVSDTPRYLIFNSTWPVRPDDSRMTFYIGGVAGVDEPSDAQPSDIWIPTADA